MKCELELMMQGMSEERKQSIRDKADELEKEFQKSVETGDVDINKMKINVN